MAKLNGPKTEPGLDRDPALTAILFFDLMVRRAAHQAIRHNMWLMYLRVFVERIERVTDIDVARGRDTDEFPTFGSYVLYHIFDTLGDWVHLVRDLPQTSPHLRLTADSAVSIPADAAETLGRSLKIVLSSSKISEDFKAYIYKSVLLDLKRLHTEGIQGEMRTLLIARLAGGGELKSERNYRLLLRSYLSMIDYGLKRDVDDFVSVLEADA